MTCHHHRPHSSGKGANPFDPRDSPQPPMGISSAKHPAEWVGSCKRNTTKGPALVGDMNQICLVVATILRFSRFASIHPVTFTFYIGRPEQESRMV